MDEEDVACVCGKYTHARTRNGIVLSYLKNESLSFATNWMDLKWLPTPLFLLEEFHRERRLAGCSPWGCKELDTTEWLALVLAHRSVRWTVSYAQRWAEDTIGPSFSTNKKGLQHQQERFAGPSAVLSTSSLQSNDADENINVNGSQFLGSESQQWIRAVCR